jgi:quercetin dioxygenase-like cupin family protein
MKNGSLMKKSIVVRLLFFEAGKRCSWHYHKIKDETFYVQSGETYGNIWSRG